jgi:hypothetical protein
MLGARNPLEKNQTGLRMYSACPERQAVVFDPRVLNGLGLCGMSGTDPKGEKLTFNQGKPR